MRQFAPDETWLLEEQKEMEKNKIQKIREKWCNEDSRKNQNTHWLHVANYCNFSERIQQLRANSKVSYVLKKVIDIGKSLPFENFSGNVFCWDINVPYFLEFLRVFVHSISFSVSFKILQRSFFCTTTFFRLQDSSSLLFFIWIVNVILWICFPVLNSKWGKNPWRSHLHNCLLSLPLCELQSPARVKFFCPFPPRTRKF